MKDIYVYEGTNVLINKRNIKNNEDLDQFENAMTSLAIANINRNFKFNDLNDIYKIHKMLFENVYEWAGEIRKINIYKEEPVLSGLSVEYSDYKSINKDLNKIQHEIDSCKLSELSKKELIHKITIIISSIWKVHAFREGNTRTICLFLYFLMKKYNLKLNVDFTGEHSKYFRNALVLASIGEYSEYEHLEMILSDATSLKKIVDGNKKYQTINEYNLEKYEYNYHHLKQEN